MNPRYKANKSNGGKPPKADDERKMTVPIGCGDCYECREQLARSWRVRLSEEMKDNPECYFVTLTFSEEYLNWFKETEKDENKIAKQAVRYFLERWRKKYKKSVRHWLITELGHEGTERIHLHGIMFTNASKIQDLEQIWKYGWVHVGEYCNEKTINYIIKYVTKVDQDHKDFRGKILCSPGIGSGYMKRSQNNIFNGDKTKEYYLAKNGDKIAMPMYYREKIWTDEQREELWMNKLDKAEKWIGGVKYDISNHEGVKSYAQALYQEQQLNERIGYLKPEKWENNDKLIIDLVRLNVKKS